MSASFYTILVPVDFSINTEVAIRRAIELAGPGESQICLLHVWNTVQPASAKIPVANREYKKIKQLIRECIEKIEREIPGVESDYFVESGTHIQSAICRKAIELRADLIIIGQHSSHYWLPFLNTVVPSELATQSGCAVLTVKPGSLNKRIRTLVVPVTDHLPHFKMRAIAALCKKNKLKVHLITFMNEDHAPSDFSAASLLQVYQWLRTTLHCPAEYTVLHGTNRARSILAYTEKINADILLVHPETETKTGWLNRHISDLLSPASGVQVLNIQPVH